MKNLLLLFNLMIFLVSASAQDSNICKDIEHLHILEANHNERLMHFKRNPFTQNYDLKYHRLEWNIDPAINYIKGAVTSYFTPTEDGFNQINFDLLKNMTITSIRYHGTEISSRFEGDDILQIDLPNVIAIGTLDSIRIIYEGIPQSAGFGSFEVNTHGPNKTPVMWTLSEPYGAKAWWPCKQDLIDKIDSIDIYVKTPSEYRVASNGKLLSETVIGDNTVFHWSHKHAIPAYLVAIAVTNYEVFSDYVITENGDSIEILNYIYPENLDQAKTNLKNSVEIMELFNEKFGIYPFANEKYGHAQFGWGGGMEHQTMSFMGGFSYSLQAHEMAHQWFGDKITCGSWEDIWLNEGFATYLTGLTNEFLKNDDAWLSWRRGKVDKITRNLGGSVWIDDTTSVGRIFNSRLTYDKGSYLLHMLRWKLGDDAFFQACKNYVNDPKLAYSYARTSDLKSHMEAMGGEDLTEFLNDWFYNQGYPTYDLLWTSLDNGIRINLSQTTSHESVDFFEMPVPVLVRGGGHDTTLVMDHTFSGQEFVFELPFKANSILIDPEYWLISKNNSITRNPVSIHASELISNSIEVIPNPFQDIFTVSINTIADNNIDKIEIVDILGKVVYNNEFNDNIIDIETNNWTKGIYIMKVTIGKEVGVKTIVKD